MSDRNDTTCADFRDIPGFEGYQVSSRGEVRVLHNTRRRPCEPRRIRGSITRKGYVRMLLQFAPNRHASKFVHNLVLETFVGPRPPGCEACHWDGDKLNNRLSNLRWDTSKANAADTKRQGKQVDNRGSNNGRARLDEAIVGVVKRRIAEGVKRRFVIAEFGLSRNQFHKIQSGTAWPHVSPSLP
jgi:hypothetical protein